MSQFEKILVPVDLSEQSVNALEYAYTLGNETNSEVIVLRVIDERAHGTYLGPPLPIEGLPLYWEDPPRLPVDVLIRETALDLNNFLERHLPRSGRVKITKRLRLGKPSVEIASVADEEEVSLVVLGLRKSFLFNHLRRNRLLKIIKKLPYPVLLAPPRSTPTKNRGERRWAGYRFARNWVEQAASVLPR